jgi:hypothetical protein
MLSSLQFISCFLFLGGKSMDTQLEELTKNLLGYIEEAKAQYEKTKSSGIEGDFFLDVKPFADLVKSTLDEWIVMASKWVQTEKPSFINEKQLVTTYDHIEKISIQSFYPKTSRKIYLSSFQSAQFVLQSICSNLRSQPK